MGTVIGEQIRNADWGKRKSEDSEIRRRSARLRQVSRGEANRQCLAISVSKQFRVYSPNSRVLPLQNRRLQSR